MPTRHRPTALDVTDHHVVRFTGSDQEAIDTAARHLARAFDRPDAGVVLVATPEHGTRIAAELRARGAELRPERFVQLDAHEVLDRVMEGGRPDRQRFRDTVASVLEGFTREGRRVYAYGELVNVLWATGNAAGALELEHLCTELAATTDVALLCTYPIRTFASDVDTERFEAICAAHTHVARSDISTGTTPTGTRQAGDAARATSPAPTSAHDPFDERELAAAEQRLVAAANREALLARRCTELEATLQGLLRTERVRDEFAAMVAHDIRNPASVIRALLHLLQRNWDRLDAQQLQTHLDVAVRSSTQIDRLLEDLLLHGSMRSGRFAYDLQPVDLTRLANEQAAAIEDLTGRRVEVAAAPSLPLALADPGRQRQILANLLSNGVRFSTAPSALLIRMEHREGTITVAVLDRGSGIAEQDQATMFEPFSQVARSGGTGRGTGLGLSITKQLVEGQGGTIAVTSQVGVGTTVTYTVPTADQGRA